MKRLRWFFFMVFSCTTVFAQENTPILTIHRQGGYVLQYAVAHIDTIEFNAARDTLLLLTQDGNRLQQPIAKLDSITFSTIAGNRLHEAVDLGLSVMWATTNIGSLNPEEEGGLFSWGETVPKHDYSESQYVYFGESEYHYIGVNICGTKYDAARQSWGDSWRLPTRSEAAELTGQCTWTKEVRNGMAGYRVTGRNGNHIFLPAAGYQDGTTRLQVGEEGFYWTGTLNRDMPSSAYNINFRGYNAEWTACRAYGIAIRAVK